MLTSAPAVMAQAAGNCSEIANDVRAAVEKDPTKVLMVVEDALVINEGCAADIVRAAITASKADATLANQIVKTANSVAPKQAVAINEAANALVPGIAAAAAATPAPVVTEERPVALASGKNPGKQPVEPVEPPPPEDDFFIPSTIRGVFLIQPPASGPLPPPTKPTPVSPAVAGP
ncbi:MAG: hypothetical protein JNG86_20355 [Verrucomicrobiaceae bacterium]|nr:hypothetical protein [Verrucomicrobiaceae bacterium]